MRRPSFAVRLAAVAAPFALAATACSSSPTSPTDLEESGQGSSAIIKGTPSDATQDAVVLLVYPVGGSAFECTGSLLAPNLVLTARHCVSATADQPFECSQAGVGTAGAATMSDFTPSNFYVVTGIKRPGDPTAKGVAAANGAKIIHDGAKNLCDHDIAFLVLDRAIPNAKILPVRVDSPAKAGEKFTAIGWGVTTTTPEPSVRQQRTGVAIKNIGPTTDSTTGLPVPDREFIIGEAICQGDSGGPALSESTGAILGVVSRGGNGVAPTQADPSAGCTNAVNIYSMASGYKDLFVQAYAAAGQDPWWEGGVDPRLAKFGETCSGNDGCRSGLCLTDDKGASTTCTQACDKANACPGGYVCNADQTGAGNCGVAPPPVATTTTTKSCGCGIGNVATSAAAAWCFGAGALVMGARRRRKRL